MDQYDKRVGQGQEWPELDMNGQQYSRPATTCAISDEQFVVIPMNFSRWEEVEALKNAKAPLPAAPSAADDLGKKGNKQ